MLKRLIINDIIKNRSKVIDIFVLITLSFYKYKVKVSKLSLITDNNGILY